MPTYEYLCKQCGERFEKVQSFRAKPLRTHDECGGDLQKVFHPSGVVFKGPGFYATDNRSKPASDAGSKSSTDSKADTKTSSDSKKTTSTTSDSAASKSAAAD